MENNDIVSYISTEDYGIDDYKERSRRTAWYNKISQSIPLGPHVKLGCFFPLDDPYICKGYVQDLTKINVDKVFLILNEDLNSLYSVNFILNDILKNYFNMNNNYIKRRLVISSNEKIDFMSDLWDDTRFVLHFADLYFSGNMSLLNGTLKFYDVKYRLSNVIRECELSCYITRTHLNKNTRPKYVEEFILQQYHQNRDKVKIIITKKVDNYPYFPDDSTILQDMINFLREVVLNDEDIVWGWPEEDLTYEEDILKNTLNKKEISDKKKSYYEGGKYRFIDREELDRLGHDYSIPSFNFIAKNYTSTR